MNAQPKRTARINSKALPFQRRLDCLRRGEPAFWLLVSKLGSGCWLWDGQQMPNGYGRWGLYDRTEQCELAWVAHRAAWELLNGRIRDGLTLDHLCRNKLCINPAHLEAVTNLENRRRAEAARTHCRSGAHPWIPSNIVVHGKKKENRCRLCILERSRRRRKPRTRIPFGPCLICGTDTRKRGGGGLGYCAKHYRRFKLWGDPLLTRKQGSTGGPVRVNS